jgi:hypothetical protein
VTRVALLVLAALAGRAVADEPEPDERPEGDHVRLALLGGGLIHDDDGYGNDASAFGYPGAGSGGGLTLEAGVPASARLWIYGSLHTYARSPQHTRDKLDVSSRAALLELRVRVLQHDWHCETAGSRFRVGVELQLAAGGGWYRLADDLDGKGASVQGPGLRVGGSAAFYLGWAGIVLAYGYNVAPASIGDRLGGRLHAGGHELATGLALRF